MELTDTIESREEEIIAAFSFLETWEEKYEYIIELGKKLPPFPEEHRKDEYKVKGCQSTVWLIAEEKDGKIFYQADSDAVIVKGLISMLINVLSGQPAKAIMEAKLNFLETIGMQSHLAQTRSNGLKAMVTQMKNYALAFHLKNKNG
jgi:cysteine desulfuration protein SufE